MKLISGSNTELVNSENQINSVPRSKLNDKSWGTMIIYLESNDFEYT